tara:strand:+ start:68745 stop:69491 length:747 start_codon:yes stop_codon:yes gene_type:complete
MIYLTNAKDYISIFLLFSLLLFSGCSNSTDSGGSFIEPVYSVRITNSPFQEIFFTLDVFSGELNERNNISLSFGDTTFKNQTSTLQRFIISGRIYSSEFDTFENTSVVVSSEKKSSTFELRKQDFHIPIIEIDSDTLIEGINDPILFLDKTIQASWSSIDDADYYILHFEYMFDRSTRVTYKQYYSTETSFEIQEPNTFENIPDIAFLYVESVKGPPPSVFDNNGSGKLSVSYRLVNRSSLQTLFFIN